MAKVKSVICFLLLILLLIILYTISLDKTLIKYATEVHKHLEPNSKSNNFTDNKQNATVHRENFIEFRSAFLDYRQNPAVTQILTLIGHDLLKNKNTFHCHYYYNESAVVKIIKASLQNVWMSQSPFCFIKEIIIFCEVPLGHVPKNIAVSFGKSAPHMKIQLKVIKPNKKFINKFAVCLAPIYSLNDNDLPSFIGLLEMLSILGADKVVVYVQTSSMNLNKIMAYYQHKGFVQIIPWKLDAPGLTPDKKLPELYRMSRKKLYWCVPYFAQRTCIQECFLSNINDFKYVIIHDFDEIIIPRKTNNYIDMMEEIEKTIRKQSPYTFKEAHFCADLDKNTKDFAIGSLQRLDPIIPAHTKAVATRNVKIMDIHSSQIPGQKTMIPQGIGAVHHYRNPSNCHNISNKSYMKIYWKKETVIRDKANIKYFQQLSKKIERVTDDLNGKINEDVRNGLQRAFDYLVDNLKKT